MLPLCCATKDPLACHAALVVMSSAAKGPSWHSPCVNYAGSSHRAFWCAVKAWQADVCAAVLQLESLAQEQQEAAQAASEDYALKVWPCCACSVQAELPGAASRRAAAAAVASGHGLQRGAWRAQEEGSKRLAAENRGVSVELKALAQAEKEANKVARKARADATSAEAALGDKRAELGACRAAEDEALAAMAQSTQACSLPSLLALSGLPGRCCQ